MKLFVDQGNTRIKWRQVADGRSEVHTGSALELIAELAVLASKGHAPEQIYLSSVVPAAEREIFIRSLQCSAGVAPCVAQVKSRLLGLVPAYEDCSMLGVDRWLAMLAAYTDCHGPCVVIDAGSALTVDVVGEGGFHKGGLLVPGLEVMRRSLYKKTVVLDTPALTYTQNWVLGCDTVACVRAGLSAMVKGLMVEVEQFVGKSFAQTEIFVAGGDSEFVAKLFERPVKVRQELVLDGLELVSCCPEVFN